MLLQKLEGLEEYTIVANYNNQCALLLCMERNLGFVVASINARGQAFDAFCTENLGAAQQEYVLRCFPQLEYAFQPHSRVDMLADYKTHAVYFYDGWLIVKEHGGDYLLFTDMDEEWQYAEEAYSDLEFLKNMYTVEHEAGNLQEALDFIFSYDYD